MSKDFSHIDQNGNPRMVDVGDKNITQRNAAAVSYVQLPKAVLDLFNQKDIVTAKGSVFQTAILAGIMAAKKTSDLIPLCHPLALNKCDISINLENERVKIVCEVSCNGKTGVEMEALTGASVAALTVYDMCKAFGHNMIIEQTKLVKKTGGKNDFESFYV
ncbi:MAG: cyclic pyranopterin monophosphate synthase MoaC [Flavobacteriales bacterium]|nr:cyclic pyranopterin monophosphate synthase MoaC [Flavobacteriales bacterium]